jgi:hypothetical protein
MSVTLINGTTQIKDASITPAKVTSGIIKADGTNPFTGDQDLGGFKLTGLGAPTNPNDAATKTYVDNAVTGLYEFKGSTDCSANPNYPSASKGDAYVVTVAGKIGGASGVSVDVGDVYFATADNAGGTQASVGASWSVLEHNLVGALLAANNLSDITSASTARTNLGATTAGGNIFTVTNPSAITFLRVNADNSVTLLSASAFRTAIGATGGTNVTRETPSGTVNGSNVTFTLANTPVSGSESIYVNGILQDSGAGNDYTISSGTITFLTGAIPQTGDKVRVSYTY